MSVLKKKNNVANMKTVSLIWLGICLAGAVPYLASGTVSSPLDALFLSVSAFTTTGAGLGIALSRPMLFYYAACQWAGGFAILVFLSSLLPSFDSGVKAGLESSKTPRTMAEVIKSRDCMILIAVYLGLAVLMTAVLSVLGAAPGDAILMALTTCSTGGLGSIAFDSEALAVPGLFAVCSVFMLLSSVSFTVYSKLFSRGFFSQKNSEFGFFVFLMLVSTCVITAANLASGVETEVPGALFDSFFTTVSFSSTTGLTCAPIESWPTLSKAVLWLLSFCGASSVSTGSGIKLIRIIVLFKAIHASFFKRIHPRAVIAIKVDGKPVSDDAVNQVLAYCIHYVLLFLLGSFVLSFSTPDMETAFFGSSSLLNNVGTSFGIIGSECSYAFLNWAGKLFACFLMLAGRLEIYALLLPFQRGRNK